MKRYSCGFLFDDELRKVCLILKNRPDWQRGKLNGVGGKIEAGESSAVAMTREFQEETGVVIPTNLWAHVVTLRFPYADVDLFAVASSDCLAKVRTMTDEMVVVVPVDDMGAVIENIPPLIELSRQRLVDREGFSPRCQQEQERAVSV